MAFLVFETSGAKTADLVRGLVLFGNLQNFLNMEMSSMILCNLARNISTAESSVNFRSVMSILVTVSDYDVIMSSAVMMLT